MADSLSTATHATTSDAISVIAQQEFGRKPMRVICPHCHKKVVTVAKRKSKNTRCWVRVIHMLLCCRILVLVGCCIVRAFCRRRVKVELFCPNCKQLLGTYK